MSMDRMEAVRNLAAEKGISVETLLQVLVMFLKESKQLHKVLVI